MTDNELQNNDYLKCSECTRSNWLTVFDFFGESIAFRRFNSSHEDVWMCDDDGNWYCPRHAYIATNMDRDEFEKYRDEYM